MSAFTMEKIAVFAPMESASVKITVTVKPGLRHNWRAANLRFCSNASIYNPPGETAQISTWKYYLPYVDVPAEVQLQTRWRKNCSYIPLRMEPTIPPTTPPSTACSPRSLGKYS